jgi:hypothetical protein
LCLHNRLGLGPPTLIKQSKHGSTTYNQKIKPPEKVVGIFMTKMIFLLILIIKKGSLVHVAPACTRSREGSNHFGSYVCNISLHFCKRLFRGLEPMTS